MRRPRLPFFGLLWLILLHLALGLTIWSVSPGSETVWFHVGRWLTGVQDSDSWKPIEIARAYGASGGARIYQHVFFDQAVKFQYPLTAITVAGRLSRSWLNVVSWFATLATAVLSGWALRAATGVAVSTTDRHWCTREHAMEILVAIGVMTFYPVVKAYSLGQIQTWITALCALMLLAWLRGRDVLAGVALGGVLLLKPAFAPLVLWGAARRRWRYVIATLAAWAVGVVLSLREYSLPEQLGYVRVLRFIGQRGEAFYANQSMNGLLNRWISPGSGLEWQPSRFPEPHTVVIAGTTAAALALLAIAIWCVPMRSRGGIVDLGVMVLAATMASPVAWEHHYGIVAPVAAAAWPSIDAAGPFGRWTGAVLAGTMLLCANFFQAVHRFDVTPLHPLESYLFFGALMLFVTLLRTTRVQPT